MFPFKESLIEDNEEYVLVERTFKKDLSSDELIWHRDREDREITLKEGEGWYIQLENELPQLMQKDFIFKVYKETWHRIINKNRTKLIINVRKYK